MKPALAAKVRLRWDDRERATLLLAPERGMLLDETAAAIAGLCDGTRTIEDIATCLATWFGAVEPDAITRDIEQFVGELAIRGLLR
jgi:pyrroloquinoline quinone biosynthesis protein D